MVITFPCSLEEFTMASNQCDCAREGLDDTIPIKAPSCVHLELRGEAMSVDQLSKLCFSLGSSGGLSVDVAEASDITPVSSSSSDSSKSNGVQPEPAARTPLKLERNVSEKLNAVVTSRKTSRQGRSSQRWLTDEHSQVVTRLVTGCVPILEGGYVLFVSASRKLEWILPKGGWESDETMEEGAIRECYEEAGALGILGPKLTDIEYESRKAKKRRLELEDSMKIQELNIPAAAHIEASEDEQQCYLDDVDGSKDPLGSPLSSPLTDEAFAKICRDAKLKSKKFSDETSSVASDASATCTHVRMSLFPLYVTEVKANWPESGRLRKVLLIDDAIEMLEMRPELRAALQEVKAKGLNNPTILAGEQPKRPGQLPPGSANNNVHRRLIL